MMPADRPSFPRDPGRLVVITAPSGAGKTSLVRALLETVPGARFSTSYTTRRPRQGEVDGEDYFFVSADEFEDMAARGAFLEHAEVFGNRYGTAREEVAKLTASGHDVLLEIDWQGARQVRSARPDCVSVFILPPSLTELERRLRGRSTDSETTIRRRLREARDDITHWSEFDFVVINDRFEQALAELQDIIRGGGGDCRTDRAGCRRRIERMMA